MQTVSRCSHIKLGQDEQSKPNDVHALTDEATPVRVSGSEKKKKNVCLSVGVGSHCRHSPGTYSFATRQGAGQRVKNEIPRNTEWHERAHSHCEIHILFIRALAVGQKCVTDQVILEINVSPGRSDFYDYAASLFARDKGPLSWSSLWCPEPFSLNRVSPCCLLCKQELTKGAVSTGLLGKTKSIALLPHSSLPRNRVC